MTIFNTIIRRPHWPREPKIRGLIEKLGIRLPPKPEGQASDGDDEDDDLLEENSESESFTDDEEVETSCLL